MARLPYLTKADLKPEDHDVLSRDISLTKILAHSPAAARAFSGLGMFIRHKSKLDARLRELAILQVGYLARAPYEWSHHVKIGYDFGVTDGDIAALIADTDGKPSALEPLALAVVRGAREMVRDVSMSAATFAELKKSLSAEHLTDLVVTIAFYCAVVRFLGTMEIDVEPDYLKYLEKYPLPNA